MTVRCKANVIYLEGACPVEDAEQLLVLLQERPDREVDLSTCTRAHSAVLQILLATAPKLCGVASHSFLQDWIVPNITRDET